MGGVAPCFAAWIASASHGTKTMGELPCARSSGTDMVKKGAKMKRLTQRQYRAQYLVCPFCGADHKTFDGESLEYAGGFPPVFERYYWCHRCKRAWIEEYALARYVAWKAIVEMPFPEKD